MESMTDILSEKEPEKVETEVVETPPETEAVVEEKALSRRKAHLAKEFEAQGRDPSTGQFIQKEKEAEPEKKAEVKEEPKPEVKPEPKQEFTEKERAFLRAAEEERKKRQELEKRLAELEKKQPQGEKKTFWDDPEGHFKTHEEKIAAQERRMMINVSERLARSKYQDFEAVIKEFEPLLTNTPGLHAQWLASPDPAEFAYRVCKHTQLIRGAGSIEAMRENIAKEERTKLEAEFKKKHEELEKQRAALPPSLSDVKGVAKQHTPVWKGPTPFEDILKS